MQKVSYGLAAAAVLAGIGSVALYGDVDTRLLALLLGIAGMWMLCGAALANHPMLGVATAGGLGTAVSAYLTGQHDAAGGSVCNVGDVFNCDVVNTSEWSEVGGVPIALLGAGFYFAMGVVGAVGWLGREKFEKAPVIAGLGGILASIIAFYLMYRSGVSVGAWCLFCIATYGFSFFICAGGLLGSREIGFKQNLGPALFGADRSFVTALIAGVAVLGVGFAAAGADPVESEDLSPLFSKVEGDVVVRGNEPVYGDPNATYTLVEYADYECPFCGRVSPQLKELVELHPDVKVIFKNYPLSSECNSNVPHAMHENACEAAAAGICAGEQGEFWAMNAAMFANQDYLSRDDLVFMATDLGLDRTAFTACIDDPATMDKVKADIADGKKGGVDSTPYMVLSGVHPTDEWIAMEYAVEGAHVLLTSVKEGIELPPAPPKPER